MTTDLDTIILGNITAQLDEVARSLAGVPGRAPQDKANAYILLDYIHAHLRGTNWTVYHLHELEMYGVDKAEAEAIASALEALALRLGAWLGRSRP